MNELTTLFGVDYVEGNNSLLISREDFNTYYSYLTGFNLGKEYYVSYMYLSFVSSEVASEVAEYLRNANRQKYLDADAQHTLKEMLGESKSRTSAKKTAERAGSNRLSDLVANETIHTNANGGKQSYTPACFDLLPPEAIATIAIVLGYGAAKYGANNWRKIPVQDHVNHALQHLFAFLSCPNEEDLSHAATRLLFALELYKVASNSRLETTLPPKHNNATTLQ